MSDDRTLSQLDEIIAVNAEYYWCLSNGSLYIINSLQNATSNPILVFAHRP